MSIYLKIWLSSIVCVLIAGVLTKDDAPDWFLGLLGWALIVSLIGIIWSL